MRQTFRRIPWWRLATAIVLTVTLVLALRAGRTLEAIVVGVLLLFPLSFLVIYGLAWKKGLIEDE